jgi:tetratricopeptide (TPR) repeat protein
MAARISEEESQQLLQTVEMFEAIAQSQPDDYQSLEILKEAYAKLGRKQECLAASKRLANAYAKVGQASLAILEYEAIAQEYPNDLEIKATLAELQSQVTPDASDSGTVAPSLAVHSKPTPTAGGPAGAPSSPNLQTRPEAGDLALVNMLTVEKIVTMQAVEPLLKQLRELRAYHLDKTVPLSLIPLLTADQLVRLEDLMTIIVEKSRLPYIPLSIYDADRDCAKMLPEEICWQHCLLPFDLISRSLLVATANPFDQATRKHVESLVKYHVFWYVSPPADIVLALRRALGLENQRAVVKT